MGIRAIARRRQQRKGSERMTHTTIDGPEQERLTPEARRAVLAAFLGWTMDAFDYFLVVLVYADIGDGLRRLADPHGVPDDRHAADASDRRGDLRRLGRSRRAQEGPDRRRRLLLPRRVPVRVRAQLHHVARAAAAVRHRHGRRVGPRRVPGDGEGAAEQARTRIGHPAAGLRGRLHARCRRLPGDRQLDELGLARPVRVQHPAGAAVTVPADAGRGVRDVGGDPREHGQVEDHVASDRSRGRRSCVGSST